MAGVLTSYVFLVLWILTSHLTVWTTAQQDHICQQKQMIPTTRTDYCGNYTALWDDRFIADPNFEPLKSLSKTEQKNFLHAQQALLHPEERTLAELYHYQQLYPQTENMTCHFIRYDEELIDVCCDGWSGNNCQDAVCQYGCSNGICSDVNKCDCFDGWSGIDCRENILETSESMKYCYYERYCGGIRVEEFGVDVSTYDECCGENGNGTSWGVDSDEPGHCRICDKANGTYTPVKPSTELPFRTCKIDFNMARTFDNHVYETPPGCEYAMVETTTFSVSVKSFDCEKLTTCRTRVTISSPQSQTITLFGTDVSIDGNPQDYNAETPSPPNSAITVMQVGDFLYLNTNFGLKVKYNFNSMVFITVDSSWFEGVNGMCGNYNDDPLDDLTSRFNIVTNLFNFRASWTLGSTVGCPTPQEYCNDEYQKADASRACSILRSEMFDQCRRFVGLHCSDGNQMKFHDR